MNTKNLLVASLVGGVVSTLVSNTPYLELVNCLLCAGFWGGSILAAWLYRRLTGSLALGQAVAVGTLAGVWAGLLGFGLSFVGLAGASGLVNTLRPFMSPDALSEVGQATTGAGALLFNLAGVITNIVFGAIGGLIGGAIFKDRAATQKS